MLWEVDVSLKDPAADHAARAVVSAAAELGIPGIAKARSAAGWLIEGDLTAGDVERLAAEVFTDAVTETFSVAPAGAAEANGDGLATVVRILPRAGVTDPAAESAAAACAMLGLRPSAVRSVRKYRLPAVAAADVTRLAWKFLASEAIHDVVVGPLTLTSLAGGRPWQFVQETIPLSGLDGTGLDDAALARLSRDRCLALTVAELHAIRDHFRTLGREPFEIELETIAQTWSEHCCHKTLTSAVDHVGPAGPARFDNLLKETVFAATQKIRAALGPRDWCVSVFRDNSGVVRFDGDHDICVKVETHNHPSAIEPYGGAATGLGGVIRDVLGTGRGAKPIASLDVFCVAPPDTPTAALPPGVIHPRRLLAGVVAGVRDYGNRMGIPTIAGAVAFDPGYLGNPLVFCGTVGIMPRGAAVAAVEPGDLIVVAGGRTGRDGIHGATFSSIELSSASESQSGGSVQIGHAIHEKTVTDFVLEAARQNLFHAITDCGAGGLSSAVGEMGATLGAMVDLDRVPLKYAGLSATEVWISEAQERMVLAVAPADREALAAVAAAEGVEATVIGTFTGSGRIELMWEGRLAGELDCRFLHEGRPRHRLVSRYEPPTPQPTVWIDVPAEGSSAILFGTESAQCEQGFLFSPLPLGEAGRTPGEGASEGAQNSGTLTPTLSQREREMEAIAVPNRIGSAAPAADLAATLLDVLALPDVASKEWIIRQYDHEVQGASVVKPLCGPAAGPADGVVIRGVLGRDRGIVLGVGLRHRLGPLDPWQMAAGGIVEAIANIVAVGADPDRVALLDNFCWGDVRRESSLGTLVEACRACHDAALAFTAPFVSGKDSLNNVFAWSDAAGVAREISIPPTLLATALGQLDHVGRAVTSDLKRAGNRLAIVGLTSDDLAGSQVALTGRTSGGRVPPVDLAACRAIFHAIAAAHRAGALAACHDCSDGGLLAAVAEMAIGGGSGAVVELGHVPATITDTPTSHRDLAVAFAETPARFLCEVAESQADAFARAIGGVPWAWIGSVTGGGEAATLEILDSGGGVSRVPIAQLATAWRRLAVTECHS